MNLSEINLEELTRGYDPAAGKSWSLPGRVYTEPDFLALERRAVFFKSWQFVCHAEKLRNPGDYVAFETAGHGLFAVRGDDGVLRAFYNVCLHRAHELLQGEGNVQSITCPYHAWNYKLSGQLRAARHSDLVDNFETEKFCLKHVTVEEFCSLVFVNLDADAAPLAAQSGALADEINTWAPDLGELTLARRMTYTIKCNWKTVIDNFLECYHCPVSHRDFVSLVDIDNYRVTTQGIYSSHMAPAGKTGNTAYNVDGAEVTDHAVWWLWPNICLLRYPGAPNFMVLNVTPIDHETTFETYDFFFTGSEPSPEQAAAIDYVDKVLQREDIDLCESVQRGMTSPAFERGRFMVDPKGGGLSEHAVHHFHGLMIDAYRAEAARRGAL
ncbi:MAG: aromatic ring-hydroxylating oxygenase subunit alpha [Rhodospirillales bacterium]